MTNTPRANSEQELLEVWQHHVHSEFVLKDAERALTTMSSGPHVLYVPIATGGRGREGVLRFYRDYCSAPS
jgi:carboxymethylenebutenolidase